MNYKDKLWIKSMEFGRKMGCHQMPSRSFSFKNYQFPVCARCTGVIIGEFIAIILIIMKIKINIFIIGLMLAIMGLDWVIQYLKIQESNNIRRLITGISGGIGLTYVYYYIILFLINIFKLIIYK